MDICAIALERLNEVDVEYPPGDSTGARTLKFVEENS
jgi:hypothetical protein